MDRLALSKLVAGGEGPTLEFKRKVRHPERIAREFVAFANTEGGIVLIGVDDDGTIYGCKDAAGEAYELETWIRANVTPSLVFERREVSITAQRAVLIYRIPQGEAKPYRVPVMEEGGEPRRLVYVRKADMSIKASREMVQLLRMGKRDRGVNIAFGELEKALLLHLENHPDITLDSAQRLLQLNKRRTSGLLIALTQAGLLQLQPSDKGDRFSLRPGAFE